MDPSVPSTLEQGNELTGQKVRIDQTISGRASEGQNPVSDCGSPRAIISDACLLKPDCRQNDKNEMLEAFDSVVLTSVPKDLYYGPRNSTCIEEDELDPDNVDSVLALSPINGKFCFFFYWTHVHT